MELIVTQTCRPWAIMPLMVRSLALIVAACICVAGCDKKTPETPDPGLPSGDVRVSPGDRLGWVQQAADAAEIATFQFALYIDGARTTLTSVSCAERRVARHSTAVPFSLR